MHTHQKKFHVWSATPAYSIQTQAYLYQAVLFPQEYPHHAKTLPQFPLIPPLSLRPPVIPLPPQCLLARCPPLPPLLLWHHSLRTRQRRRKLRSIYWQHFSETPLAPQYRNGAILNTYCHPVPYSLPHLPSRVRLWFRHRVPYSKKHRSLALLLLHNLRR